jgi:hypothetical protein
MQAIEGGAEELAVIHDETYKDGTCTDEDLHRRGPANRGNPAGPAAIVLELFQL